MPPPPANVPRLLVVDNAPEDRHRIERDLQPLGGVVYVAQGQGPALLADAREKARAGRCHVAVVDLKLMTSDALVDDRGGNELIPHLRPTRCIIFTAFPHPDAIVQALRDRGAVNFIRKSGGPGPLRAAVAEALRQVRPALPELEWVEPWSSARLGQALGLDRWEAPADEADEALRLLFPNAARVQLQALENDTSETTIRRHSVLLQAREDHGRGLHEPVVVKLAAREHIEREADGYKSHVHGWIGGAAHTTLESDVALWDVGALAYRLVGASNPLLTFSDYYQRHPPRAIQQVLSRLFRQLCARWYQSPGPAWARNVFEAYNQGFASSAGPFRRRLEAFPVSSEQWVSPLGGPALRHPVAFALARGEDSPTDLRYCPTHGDMHGDNIFVKASNELWLIDFERTGLGHHLRDFVELEGDIRHRLLDLPPELDYALDLSLLSSTTLTQPLRVAASVNQHPEARKAFVTIRHLRKLAAELTRVADLREYYWALLMETLFMAVRAPAQSAPQHRRLTTAARLAERLERWGQTWPPPDWPPVQWTA